MTSKPSTTNCPKTFFQHMIRLSVYVLCFEAEDWFVYFDDFLIVSFRVIVLVCG